MSPRLTDQRKEERIQQILSAAKQVFIEKGYGEASLKDIIEEAGMSRGWIYLYYQTKEEIFEALLDYQDIEYHQYLEQLKAESSSIWAVIQQIYDRQLHDLENYGGGIVPAFYEYFLVGWRDAPRSELLHQRYEKGIKLFEQLLQAGVERGEFTPSLPLSDIAKLISSFQEGIVTHAITIGLEKANTHLQFAALLQYLYNLLHVKAE
ncbi:hypothetical protein B9G55_22300 [Saccharibacillus sp. O16]|nr:hypothetical protein B9G55_22300 [Saccharibacillus sp. O16]